MGVSTWLFSLFTLIGVAHGARILAVVPTPTKSHHYIVEKLALDLVMRGHQVTLITTFPQEKPLKNLEEIIIPNFYDKMLDYMSAGRKDSSSDISIMRTTSIFSFMALTGMGEILTNNFLSFPVVKKFLQTDRKYDAIIGEAFLTEAILAGLMKKYNAPLIAVAPGPPSFFSNYLVGNPSPSSYIPSFFLNCTERMTFMERVINFVAQTVGSVFFHGVFLPKQDEIMRQHFGNDLPNIESIMANTSLVLVNHHYSLSFPRPYLPNMIEIGGYHVKPVQPLPKDIQQYMDNSKHGVIMFSMGSHLKSSFIPKEMVQAITKAFSRLKENVIWKFDVTDLPGLSKNVKMVKWLPQSDILAHPNLKLLITHGGALSTTEAVFRGVPMIGLPVFGDQPHNMRFLERAGYGKSLSLDGLTENILYDAITEILQNSSYKNNVKRGSMLLQDTPLPAAETAMYWIEYVIRHKGAPHLRSASLDLKWYQLHLLDVTALFLTVMVISLLIWYRILTSIWRKLCGSKESKTSHSKKTN